MDQTPKPPAEQRFILDLRDAIAQRTFFLVVGVLLIQCAFVFSYVGAFHKPTPHRIPMVVVNETGSGPHAAAQLNAIPGSPVRAVAMDGISPAVTLLRDGGTSGVLVLAPDGARDIFYVAGGGGAATVTALEQVVGAVEAHEKRAVVFRDEVPAQPGDARGLSGFYLVIGWLIGGYLAAALLAIAHGAQPATPRRAAIRLIAMAIYAFVSGLTGALIVGPLLGALTGHFLALWGLGILLVFCAAAVTMAFQVLAGILGIGITVLLFVVLGNPSAGGAYQTWLLPGFWRVISPLIPNGAGVQAARHIVYFGGQGIGGNLAVILIYGALGTAVTLGMTALRGRRAPSATVAAQA
jgi:hypothetical protein